MAWWTLCIYFTETYLRRYIHKRIYMCVCGCACRQLEIFFLYVAVKGSICTLFRFLLPLVRPIFLFRRFAKRWSEKIWLQLGHRNRALSGRRWESWRKSFYAAMKFELTRAQLTPAEFIARDGKCVFHAYLQVTISPLSSSLACTFVAKVVDFPFKIGRLLYLNSYRANCFWWKNIIRGKFFSHSINWSRKLRLRQEK